MMRRLLFLGFVIMAGCQNYDGPLRRTFFDRADDPYYSIGEQQTRGRSRFALSDPGYSSQGPTGIQNGLALPTP
jgi:hypothetical protein